MPDGPHAGPAVVGLQLAVGLAGLPVPEVEVAEAVAGHYELAVWAEADLTRVARNKEIALVNKY